MSAHLCFQTDIDLLVGAFTTGAAPVRPVADPLVLDFLSSLSRRLLSDPKLHGDHDIVAFADWCRRPPALSQHMSGPLRLGRGRAFHVAPSNVPTMFAYTLVAGLLAGNANIVRLPSRETRQASVLCDAMEATLAEPAFRVLAEAVCCVRYDHGTSSATERFSRECDVRVIWGGNDTITQIRACSLPPHATELVFFDRQSIALIDSGAWLSAADPDAVIRGFFYDTYLSDQHACSAPRAVFWRGPRVDDARADFWARVERAASDRYALQSVAAVRKLEYAMCLAAETPGMKLSPGSNYVARVWSPRIRPEMLETNPGHGCFLETAINTLDDLLPVLARNIQTLSYFGLDPEELRAFLKRSAPLGIDRVVPVGRTLDFTLLWDGYDVIGALSRIVQID